MGINYRSSYYKCKTTAVVFKEKTNDDDVHIHAYTEYLVYQWIEISYLGFAST
jgi:hypothetical protein